MPRTRSQLTALKSRNYQVLPPRNDVSLFQKRGNCIEGLPLAIFLVIKFFLLPSEYRDLMNCNLATFQPIKYETVEYNIIGPERWFAIDSVHDDLKKHFVKTLMNSVKDKSKQISMNMDYISLELFQNSIDLFEGIYSLVAVVEGYDAKPPIRDIIDLTVFNNIHTLNLKGLPMTNISEGFENVVKLEIGMFSNLKIISNINNNKTLRHLTIHNCYNLTHLDFNLQDIKTIHISCYYLTCLGEMIGGDIEDITLNTSAQLSLKTINSITKIASKLKSLHLNCIFPHEFKDYHAFQSIPSLHLGQGEKCANLSPNFDSITLCLKAFDLTQWKNSHAIFDKLQDLELNSCSGIVTLPVISSLKILRLCSMPHLQTIPTFMNLQQLNIIFCPTLVSIASLQPALVKVSILEAPSLNHISFDSPFIEKVKLERCDGLTDLSTLRNIPKLLINFCHGITSLEGLGGSSLDDDRREIELDYLKNVHDLSGLHHIHSLNLNYMRINGSISDINHLTIRSGNLLTTKELKNIRSSLSIAGCDELTKLENLQGIPLIEISDCPKLDSFDGLKNEVLSG